MQIHPKYSITVAFSLQEDKDGTKKQTIILPKFLGLNKKFFSEIA